MQVTAIRRGRRAAEIDPHRFTRRHGEELAEREHYARLGQPCPERVDSAERDRIRSKIESKVASLRSRAIEERRRISIGVSAAASMPYEQR